MKLSLILTGRTTDKSVQALLDDYAKRIGHYAPFTVETMQDDKQILSFIQQEDYVTLLDEHGKQFTSPAFAQYLQQRMNSGIRRQLFIIGGAYGFSSALTNRANDSISLSLMTFPHQLVRPVFAEQLYRAFTILNNQPYHHV